MLKIIKRIIFFFAIAVSLLIVREFISLYNDLYQADEYFAYAFLVFMGLILIYFVIIPVFKIMSIPRVHPPVQKASEIDDLLKKRLTAFEKNKLLPAVQNSALTDKEKYDESVMVLSAKVQKVRKVYVSRLFYSTAISQNGFLDAIFILSASINLIKEIFIIYNGRASNIDLLRLLRKIYTAIAIGGSETIEYAADEIIHSLSSDTIKSIPFIDKIMGSLADGFVNALLLARVSFIAENYCSKLYIQRDNELLPSYKMVFETTKMLTGDVRDKIIWSFARKAKGEKVSTEDIIPDPADASLAMKAGDGTLMRFLNTFIKKKYNR
jgi:uncharacterized membrane protein YcjF (UPF0283 family)